jgi:peptide/nickel transport system substrate-binding protein
MMLVAGCKRAPAPAAAAGPTVVACPESGCPRDDGAGARDGGELTVHVDAEPAILCDLVEHDAWSRWILENEVVETLLEQDPFTGAIGPRLAERWEADAHALTLHLRAGVAWHDGQPFTAADVAFTLGRARDPAVGADQRADLEPVSGIETPDEHTVRLALARPAPLLRQALAHIAILPEHAYRGKDLRRADASRAPIGTGPFRFASWRSGDEIVIERNEKYWGRHARLARIHFKIVRDRNVALELYRRGAIDVMWRLPPGRADEVRGDARLGGHHMLVWTPRAYFFIVWNTKRGAFGDARVRRALTMLIDRARFVQIAFSGHARAVTGPYPPESKSYDAKVAAWPYDPKAARALLDAAGVKSLKFTFLQTAGSRTVEQLATLMKEDLARAGIEMDVATVDFAVLLDRLRKHAFDASALQWTMSLEQDNYNLFHSSQADGGQNYGAFASARVDELLGAIRAAADDDWRHGLDRELHRVIHDEQPYTFLAAPEVQTMEAPRVHGLRPSTDGFTFADAWVQ